ncbi:unnamed protein product [Nyctereutes procyonoides]|uniref:(raccoon dog) hypothetical protein n=1 Tax=Nyctereutes procyonoides TaxID=34880 RepID=A0A811YC46_NYCPR|nr:unnamed protein product [Nyctereutes procyonoides]
MNQEKLTKLQAQVHIGGKRTARQKKKVVHRTATADDKKLQFSLKKLEVNTISSTEEWLSLAHGVILGSWGESHIGLPMENLLLPLPMSLPLSVCLSNK